jgi:hypothetical protein
MALLLIYDAGDPHIAAGAARRTDSEPIVRLGVDSKNLISSLDALVKSNQTFHRILFDTHGVPGEVYFHPPKTAIRANWVRANMVKRGYEAICPSDTRIYFNGCNVAEGEVGLDFLRAIASVFLLRGGGSVFGHTSKGFSSRWGLYPNTIHFWGEVKTVRVAPGGKIISEQTPTQPPQPTGIKRGTI